MKDIWTKYKVGIIYSAYLLVTASVLIWVVLPLKEKVVSKADQIQEKTLENSIFENKISKIGDMEASYEAYQGAKNNMGSLLRVGEEVDFIKVIESLGESTDNKINLEIADKKDAAPKAGVVSDVASGSGEDIAQGLAGEKFLNLKIDLEGDYGSLLNFLTKLENLNYYVDVIGLDMSKVSEESVAKNTSGSGPFYAAQSGLSQSSQKMVFKSTLNVIVYEYQN